MPRTTELPNQLRVLRAARPGWNQRVVAKKLGCGLDRYWKIENGHTIPEPKEQTKLAQIFGVPIAAIFPNLEPAPADTVAAS